MVAEIGHGTIVPQKMRYSVLPVYHDRFQLPLQIISMTEVVPRELTQL